MTENTAGYNTRLARGTATAASPELLPHPVTGGDTYSDVLDVEELTPPSPTRETQEWKVLDQKSAKRIVGSISYSPASGNATRAWSDAIQESMEDDANAANAVWRNWRIRFPNVGAEEKFFQGSCSKFEFQGVTNDGRHIFAFEITVSGDVIIVR